MNGMGHVGRRAGMGLVLLTGLIASVLIPTNPASAAVPGLVRIAATSVNDSADFKDITATCPAGKQLVGTGAEITGGFGEVGFDDLRPNGSATTAPTSYTVRAHEIDAFDGDWTITSYAICANPLPGLVRIAVTSVSDSADFKDVAATCPTGKQLVGTGAEITGGFGEVGFDDLRPNGSATTAPTSFVVRAHEADDHTPNWTVTSYAVCANPLPGLVRIAGAPSVSDSADFKDTNTSCPPDKRLTGLGAEITGGFGEVTFDDLRPNGTTTSPPGSNTVRGHEEDAFAGDWTLTAYAICANA